MTGPPAERGRGAIRDAVLLSALALALRLPALMRHPIWTDEALSVLWSGWPLRRMLSTLFRVDINPPVHYLYLMAWRRVLDALWFARLSSVVPGVLSVGLLYALGRRLYGRFAGMVAALLLALTPLHVYHSDQARYPALIAFFAVAAAWFLARGIETGRRTDAAGFAAATILMLYTHNFGVFVAAAFFAFSVAALRSAAARRPLVLAWIAIAVAGLAWTPMVLRQLAMRQAAGGAEHVPLGFVVSLVGIYFSTGFTDWNLPFFWSHLLLPAKSAGGAPGLALNVALALPVFVLAGIGVLAPAPETGGPAVRRWLAPLWFLVPLALFFAASAFLDIYKPQYLLPFLPGLLLLAGNGARWIGTRSRAAAGIVTTLLVVIPAGALVDFFHPPVVKEDWPGLARTLAREGGPGDVVLHYNVASRICLANYDRSGLPVRHVTEGHPGVTIVAPGMPEAIFADLAPRYERLWVVGYYPMRNDPRGLVLGTAASRLFELPARARFSDDPRFFVRLFATRRVTQERAFAPAVDFARGDGLPQQLVSGWYPGTGSWRWIGREAKVSLRNSPGARRLSVRLFANLDLLHADGLAVALACDGTALPPLRVDRAGIVETTIPLPPSCLARETVSITMAPDRAFVPDLVLHDGDRSEKTVLVGRVALEGVLGP